MIRSLREAEPRRARALSLQLVQAEVVQSLLCNIVDSKAQAGGRGGCTPKICSFP